MIPFNNLKLSLRQHNSELQRAILRVVKSGVYLMGPELALFEKEFAQFLGAQHAVGLGSGTDALTLALRSLHLQGQEVLVPANAYPSAFGVFSSGVNMKLCDVDPETLTISVKTLSRALTKKTRAIIVVHLYGFPAPMTELMEFAKKHKLIVIEDCAQAVGATIGTRNIGTFGHIGCFSFYPTKNLAAMGDGGAIVTNNSKIAKRIRQLRMYGEDVRYHSLEASTHSRLDEMQSTILRVRLRHIKQELEQRYKLAHRYRSFLAKEVLVPNTMPKDIHHASHLLVIRSIYRDALKKFLFEKGIESIIHYPLPIHVQPAFSFLGYKTGDFPVSEQSCKQVLSLPLYSGLEKNQQDKIIKLVNTFIKHYERN